MQKLRVSSVFMFFCFYVFMIPACVPHELENPNEQTATLPPPTGSGSWGKISEKRDGHYNVAMVETNNTCEPKPPVLADDWDLIDLDNGKMKIKFINNGWSDWSAIYISIKDSGEFDGGAATEPFPWVGGGYLAYQMEIKDGIVTDNHLFARITYGYLKGADENVKPYCERKFEASGFRRFLPKRGPGRSREGEYAAKVTISKNTCGAAKELPDVFSLDVVPQENGLFNLRMWSFLIADLLIKPDGTFGVVVIGDNSYMITDGNLTSETISFNLYIKYGLYACDQDIAISGVKRFREADGNDDVIDGIYSVITNLKINTCDNRPPIARFHLDAIAIDAGSVRLVLGNKDFTATLKKGVEFEAAYPGATAINKFSGTITPQEISGELVIDVDEIDVVHRREKKCSFLYKVNGHKLYKHN